MPPRNRTILSVQKERKIAVSIFNYMRLNYSRPRPRTLWETAEEFPSDELFYDPADFDPLGSYTGLPRHGGKPEQDADDL